jgi:integrase
MSGPLEVIGPIQGAKGADIVPPSLEQAREFARQSKAENTLRGYRADWRDFCAWCESHALIPLPASPETVAAYIAECAGRLKVATIQRRLNAIPEAHQATGLDSPASAGMVRNTLKGIRRALGTATAQKAPTLTDDIRAMVDAVDAGLIGARNRALILLGFAGAFRRSEPVGLDIADCAFGKDGLTVTLRRNKTDQDGAGRKIGIPYGSNPETCPVRTIQTWIELAALSGGALFRSINRHGQVQAGRLSGIDVARVVKKLSHNGRDSTLRRMRAIRSGRAMRRRRRLLGHRNGRSSSRPGIGACRWSGATSGMAVCSGRIVQGSWAFDGFVNLRALHVSPIDCQFRSKDRQPMV